MKTTERKDRSENKINTFGKLKRSGYTSSTIREEIRRNLLHKLINKEKLFKGIHGYDDTVLPDVERALLSGHNILFLGLRGQAKTRMARHMLDFLDEQIPIVEGSEINDDPFKPISKYAKDLLLLKGDDTPIRWVNKSNRYVEKLATPDVSISDLIGDLDPIKAAHLKLSFSDEQSIHFGLIPRSNRSIFVINELSDLQARIQVALFNILEENDLQIRGYKLKLPLDVLFIFTANPEDYTHRGNIITPLKDRIESQILTHYPEDIETSLLITRQEINVSPEIINSIYISDIIFRIIERIVQCARESEYVDEKSGVSARLPIAALELLYSAIERRMLLHKEKKGSARITDLLAIVPAITGKIELVYEGEQLGAYDVALHLVNEAIRAEGKFLLPPASTDKKQKPLPMYTSISDWFSKGASVEIELNASEKSYEKALAHLSQMTKEFVKYETKEKGIYHELILHQMSESNIIQKEWFDQRIQFKDQLASMLNDLDLNAN